MPTATKIASINTPAMLLAMTIGSVMLFPEGGALDSGVAVGEAVTVLIMILETAMVVEGMGMEVVESMGMGELDGSGTTLTQLEGKLQP